MQHDTKSHMSRLASRFAAKRFAALLVCFALLVTAACGAVSASPQATEPPASSPAPTTEPTPEPTPPTALPTGVRDDGSFDEGTLFIGDSLTYGLVTTCLSTDDRIGDASYMALCGMSLPYFFDKNKNLYNSSAGKFPCACNPEFCGLCYADALAVAAERTTAVYLMLGSNYSDGSTVEVYKETLAFILDTCPDAAVYIQTIPFSLHSLVLYDFVNANIHEACQSFWDAGCRRLVLLDTFQLFGEEHLADGIHLNDKGNELWYEYLIESSARAQTDADSTPERSD